MNQTTIAMNGAAPAARRPAPAAPPPSAPVEPPGRCYSTGITYGRRFDSGCPDCERLFGPGAPAGNTAEVIPACSSCFPADTERSDYEFAFETPAFGDWMERDTVRACLRCGAADDVPYGVIRWRGRVAPPRCDCELRWTAAATTWVGDGRLLVVPRGAAHPTARGPESVTPDRSRPVPARISLWDRAGYRAAAALFPDTDTARLAAITVDGDGAVLEVREAGFPESLRGGEPALPVPGPILGVSGIRPDRDEARRAAHRLLTLSRKRAPQRLDLDFPLDALDNGFFDRGPALRFEGWPAALDGDWAAYAAMRFDDSRSLAAERPGRHACGNCDRAPEEARRSAAAADPTAHARPSRRAV